MTEKQEKQRFGPVSQSDRIKELDAIRGFAIFGILMINVRVFSGFSYATDEMKSTLLLKEWDPVFDWIHMVFFSGKFYTLFSLLFGIGFAIQIMRASASDRSFIPFFSRRLFILLLIGIIHLWGIWFSDILFFYAICGYFLILFKGFSNWTLPIVFILLLLISGYSSHYVMSNKDTYSTELYKLVSEKWNDNGLPKSSEESETFQVSDITEVIRDKSWRTVFKFNSIGPLLRFYFMANDARIIKILAVFIIGLMIGRGIIFKDILKKRGLLISILLIGWIIGLPLNIYLNSDVTKNADPSSAFLIGIFEPFGYLCLTMGYFAAFMLIYNSEAGKIFEKLFNPVGKTALSNYLLQSVIGILIFYSAGIGLGEYFGSTMLTVSVIVIFIIQIILSNLWLKFYRYGPIEWVWRALTYGKYTKNRISKKDL